MLHLAACDGVLLGAEGPEGFGHVLALSDQPQTLAVLAWTALASTALTILLQTYALARVSAATASLVVSSEPLWAALLAAVLLGEPNYGAADVAGGAVDLDLELGEELVAVVWCKNRRV